MKRLVIFLAMLLTGSSSFAQLNVVATVPNVGMLAREIGGEAVRVHVLAPPDRDPHYLEARPTMMTALRRADLLVAVGADLEVGWLPAAVRGANNRRVLPNQPGYFEATAQISLIDTDMPADRALGDVHTQGNPHVYLCPARMADIGLALAERMAQLAPAQAETFRSNAAAFAGRVSERVPAWRKKTKAAPGVLVYHTDHHYLLDLLGVQRLGHIEPLPGIPPTAAHLRSLVHSLSDVDGVIWMMDFHPRQAGDFLARELGWPVIQLPGQVGVTGNADDYFQMIDRWVDSLSL